MSRKPSPAYFKSRMSTLLNPLFLGTITTIGLIAVVIWQLVGENQVANNGNPNNNTRNDANNSQIPPGFENPKSAGNPNSPTAEQEVAEVQEEEKIDPSFLSRTTAGEEILEPISPTASRERQTSRNSRLYDQLVNLDLFPDLLPAQGNTNDPLNAVSPVGRGTAPQFSSYQNQYTQYQYRSPTTSSQPVGSPSPLGQAVNTVMSNSNYYRYAAQRQMQQGQVQGQGQGQVQVQGGVYGAGVNSVNNNLNFPNIAPTLYGTPQSFTPTYRSPSYGVPNAAGYGGVSPYGAGVNPYGASSFSYGGGF